MAEYEVRNGDRTQQVVGEKLAFASSRHDGSPRWTELALYRTTSGRYVLEGVGRSVAEGEVDRCWTKVADDAAGAVGCIYVKDKEGVRYLTRAGRELAEQAARTDADFHAAWHVEVLD